MLQAAIAAVILVGVYRFMKSGSEYEVDWWMAFVFVLVPELLNFLIYVGLAFFELPSSLGLAGYALYFIVPFLMLKTALDFSVRSALKFAIIVPIVSERGQVCPFPVFIAAG